MRKKNKKLIWSLLPNWVKEVPKNMDPTFYGTGSYEGDLEVSNQIKKVLKVKKWESKN